tara:strand:- start:177 stop:422 length:246 start_codon:yes stop_codon:yes gene_type:complete
MNNMSEEAKIISDKIDLLNDSIIFSDKKIEAAISSLDSLDSKGMLTDRKRKLLVGEVETHYKRIKNDKEALREIEKNLGHE